VPYLEAALVGLVGGVLTTTAVLTVEVVHAPTKRLASPPPSSGSGDDTNASNDWSQREDHHRCEAPKRPGQGA
jgi:hypothetical protein